MSKFIFVYRPPADYVVGKGINPEAWQAWFDGLGRHVVQIGNPVAAVTQVGECGDGHKLGGFSIVEADDIEEAAQFAKGCPAIDHGFGVEVGAILELS